jgi:two-component system sensor histidine kinase MprB
MSFRRRISVAAAVAVAVAIATAAFSVYFIVRDQLRGQVDDSLRSLAIQAGRMPGAPGTAIGGAAKDESAVGSVTVAPAPPPTNARQAVQLRTSALGGATGYAQIVNSKGSVVGPRRVKKRIPPDPTTLAVASGNEDATFQDRTINGTHVRVLSFPVGQGLAMQIERPLTETDDVLARLRWILAGVAGGGIALAAFLGLGVGRTALRPLRRLDATVGEIRTTGDLSRRVPIEGDDELSRLGVRFNEMTTALSDSLGAQRQLVADASHELRTPLTSLRANMELLGRNGAVPEAERARILADANTQLQELTALVGDVVELARDGESEPDVQEIRLDLLVEEAVQRARRHAPEVRFDAELEPTTVTAAPERLQRAVGNLLDNACKWSPAGTVVEVSVAGGEVSVRDHGAGIDAEDLPHVFDRFYRAPSARGTPGSGLGLAIVRQIAEAAGGTVVADTPPGGGARLQMRLPVSATS